MGVVCLNARFVATEQARISVQDRGFNLGDGLFETLKISAGEIEFFDAHLARLRNSARVFGFNGIEDNIEIKRLCLLLLEKNNLCTGCGALRITLARGVSGRGIEIDNTSRNTLLMSALPYVEDSTPKRLGLSKLKRSSFSLTSHHKTLSYLENILARKEAKENGFDDALFLNEKNEIVCTSTANIFFKKDNEIFTPALSCGALPGIMRQAVIDGYKSKNLVVHETIITPDDLKTYTQCFITNSLIGKLNVSAIEETTYTLNLNNMMSPSCT